MEKFEINQKNVYGNNNVVDNSTNIKIFSKKYIKIGISIALTFSVAFGGYYLYKINQNKNMQINQNNIYGNNNFYNGTPQRELTDDNKKYLLSNLKMFQVSSVAIHYEADTETTNFVGLIKPFLEENHYVVFTIPHMMSGFPRGSFEIKKLPQNQESAYLYIGSQ